MTKFVFYYTLKSQKDNKMALQLVEMNYLQNNSYVQLRPVVVTQLQYTGTGNISGGIIKNSNLIENLNKPVLVAVSSNSNFQKCCCYAVNGINSEVISYNNNIYHYTLGVMEESTGVRFWFINTGNLPESYFSNILYNVSGIKYKVLTIH